METHFSVVPLEDVPDKCSPAARRQERPVVLVVDDEPIINFTLAAILDRSGFTALTAETGHEALEIARVIPPNVLIADLVMQEMSGVDLAIEIRRIVPDCEVILISGQISSAERSEEERLADYGFVKLSKPLFPDRLLECIAERLEAGNGKRYSAPALGLVN